METIHLFDAQGHEEKALCGANVPTNDLTGVDEYLEKRKAVLPVGNVCELRKAPAVRWAESRVLTLEADAGQLWASADELERKAEEAERVAVRYRNSAEPRRLEADELVGEARELCRLFERLKRETGLDA